MKKFKLKTLIGFATVMVLLAPLAFADGNLKNNEVARTKDGHPVTLEKDGTCVRISEETGMNTCTSKILSQTEKEVFFKFDSDKLTSKAKKSLNSVARKLRNAEFVESASIIGHTDRIGAKEYNYELSKKRAEAVQKFLAKNGYLNTNITVLEAKGESESNANCKAAEDFKDKVKCLKEDRNVEIKVNYTKVSQYKKDKK